MLDSMPPHGFLAYLTLLGGYLLFVLLGVFGQKDGANVMELKQIVLPQLQKLSLRRLPSLINVCPVGGYHVIFASLRQLRVRECPKIATRFSLAHPSKGPDAPEISMEDRTRFPAEPVADIHCQQPNDFRERLPPYIKK
ncbi:hypothetical protein Patl1_05232 [Pistacia atlantica]|uniref:Uncharacterized protein n=1 Tax=Pistacia atlantica TaxID=434234 RepID=A0ACC1BR76_9ROSI|nr:hypothetical protein Patl1_05232 [Pistacia atlantica]